MRRHASGPYSRLWPALLRPALCTLQLVELYGRVRVAVAPLLSGAGVKGKVGKWAGAGQRDGQGGWAGG